MSPAFQRLVIGCDGKVTKCCGDSNRMITLGDANETTIADIWKSEKLHKIRLLHQGGRYEEVPTCSLCVINRHNKGDEWNWLFKEH